MSFTFLPWKHFCNCIRRCRDNTLLILHGKCCWSSDTLQIFCWLILKVVKTIWEYLFVFVLLSQTRAELTEPGSSVSLVPGFSVLLNFKRCDPKRERKGKIFLLKINNLYQLFHTSNLPTPEANTCKDRTKTDELTCCTSKSTVRRCTQAVLINDRLGVNKTTWATDCTLH